MKNNKLTRKRAESKRTFVKQPDGTEVLRAKESRAKQRRWTFEADIEIVLPPSEDKPEQRMPIRTMKLEGVSYGDTKVAREDVKRHELFLRAANKVFETSDIRVRAIPHETVSNETMRQLIGYRDMSAVLDKALDIAVREASDVALGTSLGAQFIERAGVAAEGDNPAIPERTVTSIKEEFYNRALKEFNTPEEQSNVVQSDSSVILQDGQSKTGQSESEERLPFIPEIVEIQKTEATE